MTLKEQIETFFRGDIEDSKEILEKYSRDSSIFSVEPQIILYPKDSLDISNVVKFVLEKKKEGKHISVTARSAGTCMSGGSLNDSIILDVTRYMNKLEIKGRQAIVGPGVFYRDLEKATLAKGLIMPAYPASKNICAVGGMVMNDAGGEKTLAYGKTGRYVKKMKVVFSDGNEYEIENISKKELSQIVKKRNFEATIYKKIFSLIEDNKDLIKSSKPNVSKNSAGYFLWDAISEDDSFDLNKILIGSQGTLCIVTEITFDLVRVKEHKKLITISLKDFSTIPQIVNLAMPYKPECLESYDNYTVRAGLRFLPKLIKKMQIKNILNIFWLFLPEIFMFITQKLPKLVILVEFASDSLQDVNKRTKDFSSVLKENNISHKIIKSKDEEKKHWTIRRESFGLLKNFGKKMKTAPFIDDFIVRPEFLPEFLPKLIKILDSYKIIYTVAGHIGDGNFHIIPLLPIGKEENKNTIIELSQKVFDLVVSFEGSITAEHNDGIIRTPFLGKMFNSDLLNLFLETKNIFDPHNIFNPGKKVGIDKNFLLDHIKIEK